VKRGVLRGPTDGQTDMTKLTVAFRKFSKAPKNQSLWRVKHQAAKIWSARKCFSVLTFVELWY